MAKAKLFDGLGSDNISKPIKPTIPTKRNSRSMKIEGIGNPDETKEKRYILKLQRNKQNENNSKTPRGKNMTKSPVCAQKRQRCNVPVKSNLSQNVG